MALTALFVLGIDPVRIGGWRVVLAFHGQPREVVREYLGGLANVSFDVLPHAWLNNLQTVRYFRHLLERHRPRLVHLQFTPFISLFPWTARLAGAKAVFFSDQGSLPEGYETRKAPAWKRLAGRFLTAPLTLAVSASDFNRRNLIARGFVAPERVIRIYNGTDLQRASLVDPSAGAAFRARHRIPLGRVLVAQVSSIIGEKGVADVIAGAKLALASHSNLHFAFIGDGASREAYTQTASALGIAEHVTWTGLVKDPIGEGAFLAADIACQASRWQEAFGFVIAEAMAFAKPVVATRAGGIPEIVRDGETGVLVGCGDAAALAEAFVRLARDPDLRRRLGDAGRIRAEAEFDVRKNARRLVEQYCLASLA
jgi:glycosyltransferase involved in cell wall biosynthesis